MYQQAFERSGKQGTRDKQHMAGKSGPTDGQLGATGQKGAHLEVVFIEIGVGGVARTVLRSGAQRRVVSAVEECLGVDIEPVAGVTIDGRGCFDEACREL